MLAAGCSRGVGLGGALRGAPAARRVLLVVCGSSRGGGEDPSRLTPSSLLSGGGRAAFTVLSGAKQFEWRAVGKQLGGTLIVDDASHKEDVHKVGAGSGEASAVGKCRRTRGPLPLLLLHCRSVAAASHCPAGHARRQPELWLFGRRLPVPVLHWCGRRADRRRRADRCLAQQCARFLLRLPSQ